MARINELFAVTFGLLFIVGGVFAWPMADTSEVLPSGSDGINLCPPEFDFSPAIAKAASGFMVLLGGTTTFYAAAAFRRKGVDGDRV